MADDVPPPPPPRRKAVATDLVVRALFDHEAKDEKELSVTAGDILHVVRSGPDSNWLLCRTAIGEGLVPANLGHMPAVAVDETPLEHPLHEAAKRGNLPLLQELLAQGKDVNEADNAGNTPLHWAARGGFVYCVEVLLSHGAALESRNKLGDTPLHSAAWGAHPDAIAHLLAAGADRTAVNKDGYTPVKLAKTIEAAAVLQEAVGIVTEPSSDEDDEDDEDEDDAN